MVFFAICLYMVYSLSTPSPLGSLQQPHCDFAVDFLLTKTTPREEDWSWLCIVSCFSERFEVPNPTPLLSIFYPCDVATQQYNKTNPSYVVQILESAQSEWSTQNNRPCCLSQISFNFSKCLDNSSHIFLSRILIRTKKPRRVAHKLNLFQSLLLVFFCFFVVKSAIDSITWVAIYSSRQLLFRICTFYLVKKKMTFFLQRDAYLDNIAYM